MSRFLTRRHLITGAAITAPAAVMGCDRLSASKTFQDGFLSLGERISYRVHRLLGANALAREYPASVISPHFRVNGSSGPEAETYNAHAAEEFANWRLKVDGLVRNPRGFSLTELQTLPARTQITRHDCVEGWSCIGQWTGVPLSSVLNAARLRDEARYIVFHCADAFWGMPYYESIDLVDAFHPQTILAYAMNGAALPVPHGAPIRLRVERQLGYKHAKFVMRIEAVDSLAPIHEGRGGFWEDLIGYEWYAGI